MKSQTTIKKTGVAFTKYQYEQLNYLMKEFGETQSAVIHRAIAEMYNKFHKNDKSKVISVKLLKKDGEK